MQYFKSSDAVSSASDEKIVLDLNLTVYSDEDIENSDEKLL